MKIRTEPARMSKRQRKWYNKGYAQGIEDAPKGDELVWRDRVRRLEQLADTLRQEVNSRERELVFANDRIEQLTNSVVIIRDKK